MGSLAKGKDYRPAVCGTARHPLQFRAKSPWKRADFPPKRHCAPLSPRPLVKTGGQGPPAFRLRMGLGFGAISLCPGRGARAAESIMRGIPASTRAQKGPGSGFRADGEPGPGGLFGHRRHVWRRATRPHPTPRRPDAGAPPTAAAPAPRRPERGGRAGRHHHPGHHRYGPRHRHRRQQDHSVPARPGRACSRSLPPIPPRLTDLRNQGAGAAGSYQEAKAHITTRLQVGTTRGNPELVAEWNTAQGQLDAPVGQCECPEHAGHRRHQRQFHRPLCAEPDRRHLQCLGRGG